MTYTQKPCATERCGRMARKWSRYCDAHYHRIKRYGSPEGYPLAPGTLKPFELAVEASLTMYANRPSVVAAHELAQSILDYQAQCGFTYELQIETAMGALKDSGVTARDVLRRVVAFAYYMGQNRHKFSSVQAEQQGAARALCGLITPNPCRPGARYLRHLGHKVMETLFPFAYALIGQAEKDHARRVALIHQSIDFSEPAETT